MIPDNLTTSKDWRRSVTRMLRYWIIENLIQAILPTTDISVLPDGRMMNLIRNAKQIEVDIYEAANSMDEYRRLIAEKISEFEKDLAGKREERKEMEMHQQVGPGLGPILSNNSSATKPKLAPQPPPAARMHNRSRVQSSRHTVVNIEDSNEDYKSASREGVSSVSQIDTQQNTPVSSTSDQGSVQTGGKVFPFASEKSTGENNNHEKREVEDVKNSIGEQEPIVDVKTSGKPVSQDANISKEPSEDDFSASSSVKDQQTVVIASPAPVPSVEENRVDTKPESFSESSQPEKPYTSLKPYELYQALVSSLGKMIELYPERFFCPVSPPLSHEAKIPIPNRLNLLGRLKQAKANDYPFITAMRNREMSGSAPSSSPGSSSTMNQLSPGAQSRTSPHPPQPGAGMRQSTGPPVGVSQAVQQVQAAATRKTEPHMVTTAVNYGKGNPVVSPPTPGSDLIATQQQMQAQMQKPVTQILPGVPNRMLGMGNVTCWRSYIENPQPHQSPQPTGLRPPSQVMGPSVMSTSLGNTVATIWSPQVFPNPSGRSLNMLEPTDETYQQLREILKPPHSFRQCHVVLQMLKSNPLLLAAFLKQQQQMLLNENNVIGPSKFEQQILMQLRRSFLIILQVKPCPTHPLLSAQEGIFNHPQGPVSSPSQQQLMQQVRSHPPTAAQADHSPKPIASPKIQANTPENQPIPSPSQQPTPSPFYPAQTQSPHPSLSVETSGLSGPDQLTTTDQGSVQTGGIKIAFRCYKCQFSLISCCT